MKTKIKISGVLMAIAMLFTLFCFSCDTGDDDDDKNDNQNNDGVSQVIKLGFLTDYSEIGVKNMKFAMKEINDAGGLTIDGVNYTLDLVYKDTKGELDVAIQGAQELVAEGIQAAVGPDWSSITIGDPLAVPSVPGVAQAVAIPSGLLMVSHTATNPFITDLVDNDLIWRTCPSDAFQGAIGARYIYHPTERNTAAIIYRNDVWGQGLTAAFRTEFEALGGIIEDKNVVELDISGDFDETTHDYRPELERLLDGNPKVVYVVTFNEAQKLTQDMFAYGYWDAYQGNPPTMFGTDGAHGENLLLNSAQDVILGMTGTIPSNDYDAPNYVKYKNNFLSVVGQEPTRFDEHGYDAVYLIAYAMQKANSTSSDVFKAHMRDVSMDNNGDKVVNVAEWAIGKEELLAGRDINYEGASGPIEFTTKGDPGRGKYGIWEVVKTGGELTFEVIQTIDFEYTE